jgi:hypothetical protein
MLNLTLGMTGRALRITSATLLSAWIGSFGRGPKGTLRRVLNSETVLQRELNVSLVGAARNDPKVWIGQARAC